MKLSIDRITDVATYNTPSILNLILDYVNIKQKTSNLNNQDQDTQSFNHKLMGIEQQYTLNYYCPFNFSSIESLIKERNERYSLKDELKLKKNLSEQEETILEATIFKIGYYDHLIKLKGKIDYLKSIEYYAQTPGAMDRLIIK